MADLASRLVAWLLAAAIGTALVGWVASGAFFEQIRPEAATARAERASTTGSERRERTRGAA